MAKAAMSLWLAFKRSVNPKIGLFNLRPLHFWPQTSPDEGQTGPWIRNPPSHSHRPSEYDWLIEPTTKDMPIDSEGPEH
jgi:hypothetical protein